MRKNGFTTIELITSFSIASVVMLLMFNVIIILKDSLSEADIKTNMLVGKNNLSYNINKRLKEKELSSITTCDDGDKCYEFTYSDSTSDKLIYSTTDKSITFNNYTFDIIDGITVEEPTITEHYDTMSSTAYNGYFIINIPITQDNKDYSIKLVKHFNTDSVVIDVPEKVRGKDGNIYTIVEYLESTGTQYIDTGVKLPFTVEIKAKYNNFNTVSETNATLLGTQNASSPYNSTFIRYSSTSSNNGVKCSNIYIIHSRIINDLNIHTYSLSCFKNDGKFYLDNVSKGAINSNADLISYSAYLFASNNGGVAYNNMQGRIYYVKFYVDSDGTVLSHDFIPVIDSQERPCLFDKVSKTCFYNQGTGEFLWG